MKNKLSEDKVVWITGASSGIGEACALIYASMGVKLLLTSSSQERLEPVALRCRETGAAEVRLLPFDLCRVDEIAGLVSEAWDAFGRIDTMYCNAGISQRTLVEDTSLDMIRRIMDVNYFAPVEMARCVLPLMLAQGGGHIAVTSSVAGKFGFPLRCGYSSSKAALYGFFETLRAEYQSMGIWVTIICPGRIRTEISLHALDKGGVPHGVMDYGQANGLDPDKAARRIVRAIEKGRAELLVGGPELLMVHIKRFFPFLYRLYAGKCAVQLRGSFLGHLKK